MTSVLRTESTNLPITKFVAIRSLTYYDNDIDHAVLFPFSYNNGVLDIASQDGSQDMIDNGYLYGEDGFNWRMVKLMGGDKLVTSLGPNFLTWLGEYTGGSNFSIKVNPVMTRVQQTVQAAAYPAIDALNSKYAIRFTTEKPASDEYIISGNEANNYFSCWVFKTPLTVEFTRGGDTFYSTFNTQFTNPT